MLNIKFGEKFNSPFVVALGFFDCMHLGHKALVDSAKRLALQHDCPTAIFTFSNNHFKTLGLPTKLIYTFEERLQIYENVGIDIVLSTDFDKQFMSHRADVFLNDLLQYDIKAVVCGFDYTCGSDRKDCNYVKEFLKNNNTISDIVHQVSCNEIKISSTLVRELLSKHQIQQANALLSQNYFLTGIVGDGRKVGRKLGFPTANLNISEDKLLIGGVYSCKCSVEGKTYNAMLNIGGKPTFGVEEIGVEVHLDEFCGNLYGKKLEITIGDFLRDIKQFSSREQIIEQLQKDLQRVRND